MAPSASLPEKQFFNGSTIAKDFDVDEVLEKLTTAEKISLLSGTDFWHTASVHRLGIPAIRTTDGPNGVRGTRFFDGVPAACLPCGMLIRCISQFQTVCSHSCRHCTSRNLGRRSHPKRWRTPRERSYRKGRLGHSWPDHQHAALTFGRQRLRIVQLRPGSGR